MLYDLDLSKKSHIVEDTRIIIFEQEKTIKIPLVKKPDQKVYVVTEREIFVEQHGEDVTVEIKAVFSNENDAKEYVKEHQIVADMEEEACQYYRYYGYNTIEVQ